MTLDAIFAFQAASLIDAFQHYWPLLTFAVVILLGSQALLIGNQPWAQHFGEFVGGATNLRWIFVAFCGVVGAGMLGLVWWQSFRPIGPPFEQVMFERGVHSAELVDLLNHAATPRVLEIHNRHAEQFGTEGGAQSFADLSRRIWNDIISGEENDSIPAGSTAYYLDELHGRLAEQAMTGGGLWNGWQDELAGWRRTDPHNYATGPNTKIAIRKKPKFNENTRKWDEQKTNLYPVLADNAALTAPRESVNLQNDAVIVPWGASYSYFYAFLDESKDKLVPVTKDELAAFPVSPEEFHAVALDNLRRRVASGVGTERNLMASGGRSMMFGEEFGGFAAAIVLLPDLYTVMQNYVNGAFVFAIPNEEIFFVAEVMTRDPQTGAPVFNSDFLNGVDAFIEDEKKGNTSKAFSSAMPLFVTESGMSVYRHRPETLPEGVTAYP